MTFSKKKFNLNVIFSIILSILLSTMVSFILILFSIIGFRRNGIVIYLISGASFLILFIILFLFFTRKYRKRNKIIKKPFPAEWEKILFENIKYYNNLETEKKEIFKNEVQIFLGEKMITGIETDVDEKCKVLVAASAIIPIFSFPDFEYDNLYEILIYPRNFNEEYDFNDKSGNILGLVTTGGSTMVLSKPSLYSGFKDTHDRLNVGIHEFVHKVDGADGAVDGIPAILADKKTQKEWLEIIKIERKKIEDGKSEINPYALTNSAEFFAVVSEYFFENPMLMEPKHPELYKILKKIYRQDTRSMLISTLKTMFFTKGKQLGRNDPCPCGSGKKYKKCCLNK